MSIYCYKCVANGYLSLMSPYCRFIVIRVCKMALCTNMCRLNVDLLLQMCDDWLFIISVALMSIYRYVCGLNGSLYLGVV